MVQAADGDYMGAPIELAESTLVTLKHVLAQQRVRNNKCDFIKQTGARREQIGHQAGDITLEQAMGGSGLGFGSRHGSKAGHIPHGEAGAYCGVPVAHAPWLGD